MVLEQHISIRCIGCLNALHNLNLVRDWLDCLIGPHGKVIHYCSLTKLFEWFTCFAIHGLSCFQVYRLGLEYVIK